MVVRRRGPRPRVLNCATKRTLLAIAAQRAGLSTADVPGQPWRVVLRADDGFAEELTLDDCNIVLGFIDPRLKLW